MRVFVQVWCEIDPTLNVSIDRRTGVAAVAAGDQLRRVSPLGRAGVAAAVQLPGACVTAFALGSGHEEALRHALAAGAANALAVHAVGDPDAVAPRTLADWLGQQDIQLLIADRLAGLVAGRLGWAHLAGLDELRVQGGALRALRFLGRGDREAVTARLPAAVRLHPESARAPYVCRSRLRTVMDRDIEQHILPAEHQIGVVPGPLQVARPRTRLGAASVPASASGSGRLQALLGGGRTANSPHAPREARHAQRDDSGGPATPEQLAELFVRYLLHHELLSPRS